MSDIYSVLGWGSPLGTGLFLLFLGGFIFLLSKASPKKKE
jgi:hypothetical protein